MPAFLFVLTDGEPFLPEPFLPSIFTSRPSAHGPCKDVCWPCLGEHQRKVFGDTFGLPSSGGIYEHVRLPCCNLITFTCYHYDVAAAGAGDGAAAALVDSVAAAADVEAVG